VTDQIRSAITVILFMVAIIIGSMSVVAGYRSMNHMNTEKQAAVYCQFALENLPPKEAIMALGMLGDNHPGLLESAIQNNSVIAGEVRELLDKLHAIGIDTTARNQRKEFSNL